MLCELTSQIENAISQNQECYTVRLKFCIYQSLNYLIDLWNPASFVPCLNMLCYKASAVTEGIVAKPSLWDNLCNYSGG